MGDAFALPVMMHNFRTGQAEVAPEQFTDENARDYMTQDALHWNIYACHRRMGMEPMHALVATLEMDEKAYEAARR